MLSTTSTFAVTNLASSFHPAPCVWFPDALLCIFSWLFAPLATTILCIIKPLWLNDSYSAPGHWPLRRFSSFCFGSFLDSLSCSPANTAWWIISFCLDICGLYKTLHCAIWSLRTSQSQDSEDKNTVQTQYQCNQRVVIKAVETMAYVSKVLRVSSSRTDNESCTMS